MNVNNSNSCEVKLYSKYDMLVFCIENAENMLFEFIDKDGRCRLTVSGYSDYLIYSGFKSHILSGNAKDDLFTLKVGYGKCSNPILFSETRIESANLVEFHEDKVVFEFDTNNKYLNFDHYITLDTDGMNGED